MRRVIGALAVLALVVGACGQQEPESTSTTATVTPETSASTPSPTPTLPSTTSTTSGGPPDRVWSVDRYGLMPTVVLGERGELGSGCSPGTDLLPDGVWFGWIGDVGSDAISFDLACLWPGRLDPAASNDAARVREVPLSPDAIWYDVGGDDQPTPAVNAPGLPAKLPYWIFVNDGQVTEVAEYFEPVAWALSASAWPGLVPGCCDDGTIAPPSPVAPLPDTGWPADGFYWLRWNAPPEATWWFDVDIDTGYEVTIGKWIACREHPGLCPDWWVGEEATADLEGGTIDREIALDRDLRVVIRPIFSNAALIGDGVAFGRLIEDLDQVVETWVDSGADLAALSSNPEFPFGAAGGPGSTDEWPLGYRGPGGTYLTWDGGWLALEIRDGQPILYIHAGLIAG